MIKRGYGIILMFILIFPVPNLFGQSAKDSETEKKAREYFEEGTYREALAEYAGLLNRYPRDPIYNYYHGVCMVILGQEPEKAMDELRLASLGSVPDDVYFFMGRSAFQMDRYPEAIRYFERFRESSDNKTREQFHIDRWITVSQMYYRNPGSKIDPLQLQGSYRSILDSALAYQQKLDSINYLIRQEQQVVGSAGPEANDRIAVLTMERNFYAGAATDYFTAVRNLETSGRATGDEISGSPEPEEQGRGGSPYLEPAGDLFYRQPGISSIIAQPDIQRLNQLGEISVKADELMEEAQEINADIQKQKVIANGAASKREAKSATRAVERLQNKKMEKRMEAIRLYQQVNDEKYAIYNRYLERMFLNGNAAKAVFRQGTVYRREAEKARKTVFSLRNKAGKENNQGKKYDHLMQANAYELIALDNQKKALGTFAGLVPIAGADIDITRPVAEVPRTTIPEVTWKKNKPVAKKELQANQEKQPETSEGHITKPLPEHLRKAQTLLQGSGTNREKVIDKKEISRTEVLNRYPYGFVIKESLPYNEENQIPEFESLPEGVNYKIQIAAFSRQPDLSFFHGMYPLSKETIPGRNITRYYAGLFRKYEDALKALVRVRQMGFPDALIVGFYNGERSALERIRWLEDESPFENVTGSEHAQKPDDTRQENEWTGTVEAGLVFRVQLGAFRNKVDEQKMDFYRSLAGEKDVKIFRNESGIYIYSIGNFATFEEAQNFKNRLSKKVKGVFVTAWKNGRRIRVEDAIKDTTQQ